MTTTPDLITHASNENQRLIPSAAKAFRFPCRLLLYCTAVLGMFTWGTLCLLTQLQHIEVSSIMLLIITSSMVTCMLATGLAFCCPSHVACCEHPGNAVTTTVPHYQAVNISEQRGALVINTTASHAAEQSSSLAVPDVGASISHDQGVTVTSDATASFSADESQSLAPPAARDDGDAPAVYTSFYPQCHSDERPTAGSSDVTPVAFEV